MPSEIICNTTGKETRVAVVENGQIVELHFDRGDNRGFVGNVYLGKVVRVLPGMQAAFVDVGLERAAFLYVGDIYPEMLHINGPAHVAEDEVPEAIDTPDEDGPRATPRPGMPPIQDLLKEGQELVVQVSKDPIGAKGARLTTHVALAGRYLVFMPTVEHVGISRRIEKEKERRRLREFVEKHRPAGAGFIVRTVCEGQPNETLKADMDYLQRTWERIEAGAKERRAPALLHQEHGLVVRGVRDLFDGDVERMVLDDRRLYEDVRKFMADFMPRFRDRVHLYKGAEPIFDTYGVESQIKRSLGRKVWLKSGGYLVIDQSEALMAIDVNSGKFVGTHSLEETTLQTNLEAVHEVVYQLRLRNIGGLIVIDFIDMDREVNRETVYRTLEEALKKDRSRTNALKISELGLVEMTRKRVQEGLDRYLTEPCPICAGVGTVRSRPTLSFEILREIRRVHARSPDAPAIIVNTTPDLADLMYGNQYDDLLALEAAIGRKIVVRAQPQFHPEQFEIYARP